jgi:hypothetical protein
VASLWAPQNRRREITWNIANLVINCVVKQDPFDEGEDDEIVWGITYLIDPAREDEVREYLGECDKEKVHPPDGNGTERLTSFLACTDIREQVINDSLHSSCHLSLFIDTPNPLPSERLFGPPRTSISPNRQGRTHSDRQSDGLYRKAG